MFNNIVDGINFLENIKMHSKKTDISRITAVLEILGNPHLELKCIHVAGTNGKGSTTNFISSIIKQMGYKVAKFISPYVICFNERIQINDEFIDDDVLLNYINEIYNLYNKMINEYNLYLTFFECTLIIAFKYFKDMNVDYCVIETGIGGLIDATNVISSLVSVVTNISYDHIFTLGDNIRDIAKHKYGIVKENGHLITLYNKEIIDIIYDTCQDLNASYNILKLDNIDIFVSFLNTSFKYLGSEYILKQLGHYQAYNAILAIETIKYVFGDVSDLDIKNGLYNALWPARIEVVKEDPIVIIDGAHNEDGMNSLKKFFNLNNVSPVIILGVLRDKDVSKIVDIASSFAKEVIFTSFDDSRACSNSDFFNLYNNKFKFCETILDDILDTNEIYLVCGSLHFASYARKKFK